MSSSDHCANFVPNRQVPVDNRGFPTFVEFTDLYGATVRVKTSSLATQDAVWIFTESDPVKNRGYATDGSVHLCREMAVALRDALDEWITGAEHVGDSDE